MAPPKVKGSRAQKNKPPNTTKVHSKTPQKFLVCCPVTVKGQRLICRTSGGAPIGLYGEPMGFESGRGPKQRKIKKEKTTFCKLKSLFFFLLFFHYSFSFAIQR
jgi:hypothetical protein